MITKSPILFKSLIPAAFLAGFLTVAPASAASYPESYYDSLEGKCGYALMQAIKARCVNHTAISYGNDTWSAFEDTDTHMVNGQLCWWDMYSTKNVSAANGHSGLNIEHSVANSWWGHTKNDAYKDIVHLNPSNSDANSAKGNYPLAEVGTMGSSSQNKDYFSGKVGKAVSGQGNGATWVYEPADEYKGDFARAFMYMFCVYDDINWQSNTAWMYDTSSELMFQPWAYNLLLKWSKNDPVGEKELNRNEGIYKHQKNRNPFIDLPALADHIWGDKRTTPFSIDGDPDTPPVKPDDPEVTNTYNWLPQTDTSLPADWIIEDVTLPAGSTYIWSWKTLSKDGSHYLNASAYNSGPAASESYIWSPVVDYSNVEKAVVSFEHAAKFQANCKDYCKVLLQDDDTGDVTEIGITIWPEAGSWTFASTGDLTLPKTNAKKVRLGFKYASDSNGADTWEIRNVKLQITRMSDGINPLIPDTNADDSDQVGVSGNSIYAPEGAAIFDLNGRRVSGINLAPGIYIVVKSTFCKNLKIVIK